MQRYDYIKRMIEQLGAALARIAALRASGKHRDALLEVRRTYAALEINPHLLRSLDGASVGRMLQTPDKVRAVARLLKEEAELYELMGQPGSSRAQRRQALALYLSLGEPDPADAQPIEELRAALGLD